MSAMTDLIFKSFLHPHQKDTQGSAPPGMFQRTSRPFQRGGSDQRRGVRLLSHTLMFDGDDEGRGDMVLVD